jgi:two-component system, cell cycle response regulator CtrA
MTITLGYVKALELQNDKLREKIVTLEEMLGRHVEAPLMLGLTKQESKLFCALVKRDIVTKESAMDALYRDKPNSAEVKIVDVFVSKIRRKLRPYDISIETVWGRGYLMPGPSKLKVAALLEQSRAA